MPPSPRYWGWFQSCPCGCAGGQCQPRNWKPRGSQTPGCPFSLAQPQSRGPGGVGGGALPCTLALRGVLPLGARPPLRSVGRRPGSPPRSWASLLVPRGLSTPGPSPLELLLFLCLQSTVPSLSPSSAAPGQGQQLDRTRPPPVVTAEARPLLPGAVRGPVTNHTVSPFLRLGSEPAEAEAARLCQVFMREQEESHPGSQRD